jgi:predicted metal-dependent enzyme (double-stranded beta helix superfamily)
VRELAGRLIDVLDEVGNAVETAEKELTAIMEDILALPDIEARSALRSSGDGPFSTGWLYYDGDLRILTGLVPAGFVQKPHNHGTWNLFGVAKGAMHYRSFQRLDDRSQPNFADLQTSEDRILRAGDVTVLPGPPHDIHATAGLVDATVTVLVSRQQFNAVREQYLPELKSYYEVGAEAAAR